MLKILLSLLLSLTFSASSYADRDDGILPLLEGIAIGSILPRPVPPPVYYPPEGYYPQQRVYVPVPAPVYYEPAYRYEGYEYGQGHRHNHRRWDRD